MKTILISLFAVLTPLASYGLNQSDIRSIPPTERIPYQYSPSGEIMTVEWACPIEGEFVQAKTRSEALAKVEAECKEQVRDAANRKPDVLEVISTETILPDVNTVSAERGFILTGTYFLATQVMKRGGTEE